MFILIFFFEENEKYPKTPKSKVTKRRWFWGHDLAVNMYEKTVVVSIQEPLCLKPLSS